ncbi:RNA pseudouridine synthase [Vibrio azureus]|uniref:Putative pseudouridine synthase n=1 Tax=Vibrio azureus NBRC 104587 TaxID=1219077 RepID=U3BYF7_9VIBR|nr:TIGR01621 family pseudouridine synthase [Vibrio azureus]AUI86015.1 RNA pseudouridine synthase [Vibrio azureus]GAD74324.1 putative pseudouridine synthase [Vibrio azureus NBRC 104587]
MFDILHSHPDFVLINKHPNISVHKDDGDIMLLQEVAKQTGDEKLYLIHRLDKMTSGLLLLGRNSQAASQLSQKFAARQVEKFYLAIGAKKPKKKQGLVIGDMERTRRSAWKLNNSKQNPAVTQFFSLAAEPGERLFLCKPHTGKTHQIRVALKSVGSSIVGDPIYNPGSEADRGYLHAFCLCFSYQGEQFRFVCDPRNYDTLGYKWRDEVTAEGINSWLSPWQLNWPTLK